MELFPDFLYEYRSLGIRSVGHTYIYVDNVININKNWSVQIIIFIILKIY